MDRRTTILIVDGDRDVHQPPEIPGYSIFHAASSFDAIDLLGAIAVDAIVTSYAMPDLNGIDLLQRVRLTHPDVARILLTTRADVHLAVWALNDGAVHGVLLKPWDELGLHAIVKSSLASRGAHVPVPARMPRGTVK
jgi:DNA-binding NtrC family response regulator